MRLKTPHWTGIIISFLIIIGSLFIYDSKWFFLVIGIGIILGVTPFVITMILESKDRAEKEKMFLEFTRNLVESVKTGTPISKAIVNAKEKPYGTLSPNIRKLSNQISLGIPLATALQTFSKDVNNKTISRALTLIGQAEKAGGDIGEILESVTGAVSMSDKLKKERKAAISTLVIQGYVIFFIFLIIVIIMQYKILPMVAGIANVETIGVVSGATTGDMNSDFSNSFLYLLLAQGFFSGLAIGLLGEGDIKTGVKHSFALMISSFLVSAIANLILG